MYYIILFIYILSTIGTPEPIRVPIADRYNFMMESNYTASRALCQTFLFDTMAHHIKLPSNWSSIEDGLYYLSDGGVFLINSSFEDNKCYTIRVSLLFTNTELNYAITSKYPLSEDEASAFLSMVDWQMLSMFYEGHGGPENIEELINEDFNHPVFIGD